MNDFQRLIGNMTKNEIFVVRHFVLHVASISAEKYTGKTAFEINSRQGGISGEIKVSRTDIVKIQK